MGRGCRHSTTAGPRESEASLPLPAPMTSLVLSGSAQFYSRFPVSRLVPSDHKEAAALGTGLRLWAGVLGQAEPGGASTGGDSGGLLYLISFLQFYELKALELIKN